MSQTSPQAETPANDLSASSSESFEQIENVGDAEAAAAAARWDTNYKAYWWPLCPSSLLLPANAQTARGHPGHQPHAVRLLGIPLVVFRQPNGEPACLEDRCPHRATRLSTGRVINGTLQCRYHGWNFDGVTGKVTSNPTSYSRLRCRDCPHFNRFTGCEKHKTKSDGHFKTPRACTKAYKCKEKQDFVWVWLGELLLLKRRQKELFFLLFPLLPLLLLSGHAGPSFQVDLLKEREAKRKLMQPNRDFFGFAQQQTDKQQNKGNKAHLGVLRKKQKQQDKKTMGKTELLRRSKKEE
ncbi:hypothetical protein Efla_007784 [Eimeria flavescens]